MWDKGVIVFFGACVEFSDLCLDPALDLPTFDVCQFCLSLAIPVFHDGLVVDTDAFFCVVG